MGSFGGKSPAGSTTTTSSPWAGAVPYLTGQNAWGQNAGVPGTMPSAANLYQNSGWSPAMANQANNWQNWLGAAGTDINSMGNTGTAMAGGSLTPNISAIGPISGAPTINSPQAQAQQSNIASTLHGMGPVDPTGSLQQLMSGQVAPGMMGSIGNEANAMYGQATQNLMQQVMPQLNEQAIGAGGYGGSRQGIAQGLALSNMQQNLAPQIAGLYNQANQTAQGLQGTTANNLAGLGASASNLNASLGTNVNELNASNQLQANTQNAQNALAAQQFNANLGLQNNAQGLQANQLGVANRLAGSQMMGNAFNMGNQNLQTGMTLTQAPNQYNWQNLGNYTGVINGTAGLGGSQTSPYFQNSAANLGSLGLTGLLGYSMLA